MHDDIMLVKILEIYYQPYKSYGGVELAIMNSNTFSIVPLVQ